MKKRLRYFNTVPSERHPSLQFCPVFLKAVPPITVSQGANCTIGFTIGRHAEHPLHGYVSIRLQGCFAILFPSSENNKRISSIDAPYRRNPPYHCHPQSYITATPHPLPPANMDPTSTHPHTNPDTHPLHSLLMAISSLPDSTPSSFAPGLGDHSKKLYLRHENIAKTLAGKDAQYVNALQRARSSAKEAKRTANVVSQISDTEAKLTEQLDQLESKKLRKRFFPNKTNEEITKIRNNLHAVVEEAALAKKKASESRKQARADANVRDQLRADAEKLQHSERTRRAILETVYGGLEFGSVEENSIETERDRLLLVTDQAKDSLSVHKQALNLLNAGYELLRKARRLLHDAQVTNTVDMFNGAGFGFVAGMTTQYSFQEAAKTARSAGKRIEHAIKLNPELPIAKLAKQRQTTSLGLTDFILDGIVTDLVVRMAVDNAVKLVNDVMKSTEESIMYQQNVVKVAQGDFRGFSDELERTSDELTQVRADLFHEDIV